MNAKILIKPSGIGNYQCLQLDDNGQQYFVGDGERLAEAADNTLLVYVAPAEAVTLHRAGFEDHERKMLAKTLPYSLEEDLLEDVEELHFALGNAAANNISLAVVKRQSLDQWLEDLALQGVEVQQMFSELQLLPLAENGWSLLVDGDRWLLRFSASEGFSIEADIATLALQLLLDQVDQLPEQLQVFCAQDQQAAITNQLPDMLRGIVTWREEDYWQVMAEGFGQQTPQSTSINLLQGDYALNLPWKKWWKSWQRVALFLLAAIVLQFTVTFVQLEVLEANNVALRAEIESTYRGVVPRGAIMDPERQLRRKVDALKGSGGEGFVSLLAKVGAELAKIEGLSLQSLNYAGKQSEIRLTVLANDFDDVETLRASIEGLGLKAELTGSSADGNKTRARLRIKS